MRLLAAGCLSLLLLVAASANAASVPIVNSKHNLSALGPGPIKSAPVGSGGTTEVCVFCHTPHGASGLAPLWNRTATGATYTLYSSDYLISLNYPGTPTGTPTTPAQPNANSKLCLSCHDGTIALGSVYNLPGSGGYSPTPGAGIPMTQSGVAISGGKMPTNAAGHLGTNLTDDHPVGFMYDAAKDTQLEARAWPWNTAVKLYPDSSAGTVECATCHNAHDDQFGKFLRMDNTNAALCTHCHIKTGYAASVHQNPVAAAASYTPAGGTATNVAEYSCRSCHKPHNSGSTPYIQRGAEENTCYERGCHGSNTTYTDPATPATPAARLIQPEMSKTRRHPVNDPLKAGKHKNVAGGESAIQLGGTSAVNRHAECQDCHNPHQAQPTVATATRGALKISAALTGTWGVEPNWASSPPPTNMSNNAVTFAPIVSYAKIANPTDEYQVCLKCHSNYTTLPSGVRNIAQEINPFNSSYHGIVPNGETNTFVTATTTNEPWGTSKRVWCSDCHGSEAGSGVSPKGPHGSNNSGTAPGNSNTDKMLVATIASTSSGTPLCLVCHKATTYTGNAAGSNNSRHGTASMTGEGCFACHMWSNPAAGSSNDNKIYPHGMNARWAVKPGSVGEAGSLQLVRAFNGGWYTNMNYGTKQCWSSEVVLNKRGQVTEQALTGSPCGTHAIGAGY